MTRGARIDPADGTIAEAAPLGNDNSLLNSALVAFKVGAGRQCSCSTLHRMPFNRAQIAC